MTSLVERELLEEDDPELLKELDKPGPSVDDILYPEPELGTILNWVADQKRQYQGFYDAVQHAATVRYLRDETPEKWRARMNDAPRVHSRLSHNEIMRVAGMITRNRPKFKVSQAGKRATDAKKARAQTRWLNNLLKALERKSPGIWRKLVDGAADAGKAYLEVFITDAYDRLDLERRSDETAQEYDERTEEMLLGAGLPFGVRFVHALAAVEEMDDDGLCRIAILERKPYRTVWKNAAKTSSVKELDDLHLPRPGTRGWPTELATQTLGLRSEETTNLLSGLVAESDGQGDVLTIRYYDKRWMAYIVGGVVVECRRHGMPGLPVGRLIGQVTSSPNPSEEVQGITWGMVQLEETINTLFTKKLDNHITYGGPKLVVETLPGSPAAGLNQPRVYDFSDPRKTPVLLPGQTVKDAFQNFQPHDDGGLLGELLGLFTKSGLNPVATGESPGSDPAGYTVNTLSQAAQSNYETMLDNYAALLMWLGDFVRLMIRETLKEKVYLSVPMEDRKAGGTEWLGLGPDDVDETPCEVIIDPLSDANRIALRQSLTQGWKDGLIPRGQVQAEGYGAEDPELWDDEIIVERAVEQLTARAIQEALEQVGLLKMDPAAQAGGMVQPPPAGELMAGDVATGAVPAPLNPPSVGPGPAMGPIGGERAIQPSTALAGTPRGGGQAA